MQSGLAVSPSTEAELYPSTDWEETFPSALWLSAQCHNYSSVFTAQPEDRQLDMELSDSRRCPVTPPSLSADSRSCCLVSFTFLLPSSLLQSSLSFPFPPPAGRFANRRQQPSGVGRRAEQPKHRRIRSSVKVEAAKILHPVWTFKIRQRRRQ